jgi:APA family basic amino acid/polyamine antiporter
MARKLGTWTLGGLMVGPILGSGILLLPPLAHARLGPLAIWAWLLVLLLGGAFAAVFIQMALRTRTAAGIAELVAREWGPAWGELASNYLTGAVVFGAVPVELTAARLWPEALSGGLPTVLLAVVVLCVTVALLLAGLTTVSRLSLVLSTATAASLGVGGALGLARTSPWIWPAPSWDPALGPTLLILFWAIVGWEVVGNYTEEVEAPERTIPLAGLVSLAAVTSIYLVTTLSLQTLVGAAGRPASMTTVLEPLLGGGAAVVAGLLAGGLCLVTVLMFVGAVTRMTAQRARDGALPRWLGEAEPGATPRRAILAHGATSLLLLGLVWLRWVDLEGLVSAANLFFLGNALLGLAAAWRILPGAAWRAMILALAAILLLLLTQGRPWGWLLFGAVSAGTALRALSVRSARRRLTRS